jgi:hypothetical protein
LIPLQKTWILGVSLGGGGATVDHDLSASYLSLEMSLQRQLSRSLGLQAAFGLDIQTSLDPRPGADEDERGSLRGFELSLAVPFYALESNGHSVFVAPVAGLTNHGYRYTDFNGSGALVETAAFRYIQTRFGAALGYQYVPYDKYSGSVGFGIKLALLSFGDAGSVPGAAALRVSGGLLVRF